MGGVGANSRGRGKGSERVRHALPRLRYASAVVTAAVLAAAGPAGAQQWIDPAWVASGLRAHVDERGAFPASVWLSLLQFGGPVPRAELDALADSVVEVAVSLANSRGGLEGRRLSRSAAVVLRTAGAWVPGRSPAATPTHLGRPGIPYPGAAERIMAIAHRLDSDSGLLVVSVLHLPNREENLCHVRGFLVSGHTGGAVVIQSIVRSEQPDGLALLRELHRDRLVPEPRARWWLDQVAEARGWR